MSGGGSGGGGTTVVNPSTTTSVQDIPQWEQGYVTDLLGKAQTISNQPYQQFPGQEIAGFTPDQLSAFSNIEGMGNSFQPTTQAGVNSAMQGANTAGGIYDAGAGNINAATGYNPLAAVSPYLGAAAGYNSAAASQPWLNQAAGYEGMAANAATPQGIQSYMSPYTNDVVQGLQNEANLNWNQNIMPGVNDKFVGSGQFGSGRNAQVLGQAAGNFQTGLSSNVANALESGYSTAGNQAAQQAALLANLGGQSLTGASTAGNAQSQQVTNLLNQASTAGNATQQQAGNLQTAGVNLGNLAATQGQQQLAAGTALGNLGAQQLSQGTDYNTLLQAAGQQQQQLNQSNLNQAQTDWQNQVNWPAQQTEYLNQIIRGLPTPTATTTAAQTPAYSVSPLAGLGGALTAGLGSLTGKKKGGLIKTYADGGQVDDDNVATGLTDSANPLVTTGDDVQANPLDNSDNSSANSDVPSDASQPDVPQTPAPTSTSNPLTSSDSNLGQLLPLIAGNDQQMQLLSMARGMLTPTLGGHGGFTALGQSVGALTDEKQREQERNVKLLQWQAQQQALQYQREQENKKIAIEQQNADTMKGYRDTAMQNAQWSTEKLSNGKIVNVNKITGEIKPISIPGGMGSAVEQNQYGYDIGSVPQGTAAPVLDTKFNPYLNAPPGQQEQTRRAAEKQLDADNKTADINRDAIVRLNKAKDDIKGAYTGGFSNLPIVSDVYNAFSTPRQEIESLNKELALAPGERPQGMRLTQGEVYMLKKAVPGNDKSEEANTNIANAAIAVRERPIEWAQFKTDFIANNGYWNGAVGQQMFNKYVQDNPIFDPKAVSDPKSTESKNYALNPNRQSLEQYANSGGFKQYGVSGTGKADTAAIDENEVPVKGAPNTARAMPEPPSILGLRNPDASTEVPELSTPESVRAAFKAGQITKVQAIQMLKSQHGFN